MKQLMPPSRHEHLYGGKNPNCLVCGERDPDYRRSGGVEKTEVLEALGLHTEDLADIEREVNEDVSKAKTAKDRMLAHGRGGAKLFFKAITAKRSILDTLLGDDDD